ncbi:MAG: ergothioneine biosynthesis glutamate--cysteine ligase EgtA [Acidimicrobiia bacterium]
MPSPIRTLTVDDVRQFVDDHVFAPDGAGRVGIELEWVPVPLRSGIDATPDALTACLPSALPGGSRLTFEPGGQLELSGPAYPDVSAACRAMKNDTATVRRALDRHGIDLVGVGLDPRGMRTRVIDAPRYAAMEEYFDTRWPAGRTMMRNTAAIQVNLDLGMNGELDTRWQRAHDLGPVLAASFANSPFDADGRSSGWRSTRLAVWDAIDPGRTAPAHTPGMDARTAWTRYALDATTMMIRLDDTRSAALHEPMTFEQWIAFGHELGWPTLDDWNHHLTTLFPPVRPRGWLELRMIDALPDEWWPVAVAVTTVLLDDATAADAAADAVAPTRGRWLDAAQHGLTDPTLHTAAARCFTAALEALTRLGVDRATLGATAAFQERFVGRGRCPADERLDQWNRLQAATV